MSNHLISAVYKRDLRTPMRKSVMVLLADKASDDGAGVFASKQTMADELCCSKQAVIDTIKGFICDGLLVQLGTRQAPNGFTVEYGIVVEALEALPLVKCHADREARRSTTLTGQTNVPVKQIDRSTKRIPPVKQVDPNPPEPSSSTEASPPTKTRAKTKPYRLPVDWKPVRFADCTVAREVINKRGQDWARAALESFRNWAANAEDKDGKGRKTDWQAAWGNWVIKQDKDDGLPRSNERPINLRGSRPDPAVDLRRIARERREAEGFDEDPGPDSGPRVSLPAYLAS